MRFYLGTHRPQWLNFAEYRMFVSYRQLRSIKKLPVANFRWSLDSGAFSEIAMNGKWTVEPKEYVDEVYRISEDVGSLYWAAPQDWMCEPHMIKLTGLSVIRHQLRTVENLCLLRSIAPDLPFIPVIQGWTIDDFHRCIDLYAEFGVDLTKESVVGIGSVCRRQATTEIGQIVQSVTDRGLALHGFGVKKGGLIKYGHLLRSADSMAWSYRARRSEPLEGCEGHKNCANCFAFADLWRRKLITEYKRARR